MLGMDLMFLFTILLLVMPSVISEKSECRPSSQFGDGIKKEGYAECPSEQQYLYLKGLEVRGANDNLKDISAGKCCRPPSLHQDWPFTCHSADWQLSFSSEGWATCSPGFFLRGFHRGSSDELKSIQWATCCKPSLHPYSYPDCYDQDAGQEPLRQCSRDGFLLVGLYRGAGEQLSSVKKLRCCKMLEGQRALTSLDQAKSRVMDVTLENLGTLAHAMGYGWTGGCRTKWPGMDFRREGDTWTANYQQPCEGFKAEDRLKITYENFSFKVKNVDYGKPVVDTMKPIVQDIGEIQNEDPLPVETTITREIKTVRTVVHSSTSRWKAGIGASISLSYKSPGSEIAGSFSASVTLSGEAESGQVNKDENGEINWDIMRVPETQKVDGLSVTRYQLNVARKNVTVPYKATIQVQFSAKLEGFLRWGGGKGGSSPNFHETHQGSESRPDFPYSIGSPDEPLFKFLKRVSQRDDKPWLWNDMKQKYEWLPAVINALTNESLYEFELEGKFHDVSGLSWDVKWSDSPVS
ncbi:uncharacterized protein LOC110053151 [Orbicella faveolata]|uniref:uncharacterized protein LOC110053151 n=1 Tax=Orbicella faveolata TaxID=48498 RepID=UPI0009E406D6|nr:uncharacterized protein LOC110053151 [Orbicella faveolata]